jgi:hypothetical protein
VNHSDFARDSSLSPYKVNQMNSPFLNTSLGKLLSGLKISDCAK